MGYDLIFAEGGNPTCLYVSYLEGEESGKDALGPRNQIFPLAGRPWAPSSVYSDFSYHLLVTGFVLIAQLMVRGVHMMT